MLTYRGNRSSRTFQNFPSSRSQRLRPRRDGVRLFPMMGSHDDPRPMLALDWSFHGIHATFDGSEVLQFPSVESLLSDPRMSRPHRIAAEATFESWDPQRRRMVITSLREKGHELFVYRPLATARARHQLGLEKSDAADARIIWLYAKHPRFHLYAPAEVCESWAERFATAQQEYALVRLAGQKADLAAKAAAVLGPLAERSEHSRLVLSSASGYSETLLAVLWFVASKGFTRGEMEKLLGLYGAGYPSLLRSEIHTHSARHARKRLNTLPDISSRRSVEDLDTPATSSSEVCKDWRVYRKELRRAYGELSAWFKANSAEAR